MCKEISGLFVQFQIHMSKAGRRYLIKQELSIYRVNSLEAGINQILQFYLYIE